MDVRNVKASLNQAGPPPTFACPYETEAFVKATSEAGFEGIELRFVNLEDYMSKKRLSDLRDLLSSYDLEVVSINHIGAPYYLTEKEFRKFLNDAKGKMEICNQLNCDKVVTTSPTLPSSDIKQETVIEKCSTSLRRLADLGAEYGVKIAFEPLVKLVLNGKPLIFAIDTPKKYKALLEATGSENVGFTLDTFHFYLGDMIDEIKNIPDILIVHMSDAQRGIPLEELDNYPHRVFPGEGVIDFDSIIRGLKAAGYDGYLSIEVFHPPYWKLTPLEFAKKARKSLEKALTLARGK